MEKLEGGLYQAQAGNLRKLDIEDDGLKKLRVSPEAFEAVRAVQKQMRSRLGGRKPDIALVAEAMLLKAAELEGIEESVRLHALRVSAGE